MKLCARSISYAREPAFSNSMYSDKYSGAREQYLRSMRQRESPNMIERRDKAARRKGHKKLQEHVMPVVNKSRGKAIILQ